MKLMIRLAGLAAMVSVPALAQNQQPSPVDMQKAMEAMGKALGAIQQQGGTKPVVDFREMKALLPKELPGGLKGQLKGQKSGAMGMTIAEAEGHYGAENGDSSISIKLSDISGTGGLGVMAHAAWASAEIDNESDDGYEKSTTVGGFKALEKYNTKNKGGELQVLVDSRFVVEVRGSNVKMEQIKSALDTVDLKKLAALKPATATAPAPQ